VKASLGNHGFSILSPERRPGRWPRGALAASKADLGRKWPAA